MSTNKTIESFQSREGSSSGGSKIKTGLEGQNIPTDFHIPACSIEDLDRAIFNLFDKDVSFVVEHRGNTERVPVIFATGERFALVKRQKPIRDKNNTLILPLISVRRTGINQAIGHGHGLGQDTGDLVIKTRLDEKDRRWMKIRNKLGLLNQKNVASINNFIDKENRKDVHPGTQGTRRNHDEIAEARSGYHLDNHIGENIIEVITIPFPKFYTGTYEVTFWTQYTQHMNTMIEQFLTSYQAPGNQFRVESDKGYWFVAYIGEDFASGNNFDDFTDQERIVRYTFTLTADGYLVANQKEGMPSPFRRYISAPFISFETSQPGGDIVRMGSDSPLGSGDVTDFILSDTNDPKSVGGRFDKDGNLVGIKGEQSRFVKEYAIDPFTGKKVLQYVKVLTRNQRQGETVFKTRLVSNLGKLK